MRRTASLAAVVVAGLLVSTAQDFAAPAASAQDKKGKDEDKQKKREQAKRDKALTDIANDFGAMNVTALLNRVPQGKTISLSLGGASGDYSVDQARGVMDKYFGNLRRAVIDTTSDKVKKEDNVGVFPLTLVRKSANKPEERKLQVTLGPVGADGAYTLAKLVDNM